MNETDLEMNIKLTKARIDNVKKELDRLETQLAVYEKEKEDGREVS